MVFDHIPQYKAKGVFFHHLVKSTFLKRGDIGREEESVFGILTEDLHPPHFEQPLHRGRIFYEDGFHRFNRLVEALNFFLKRLDLSKNFF